MAWRDRFRNEDGSTIVAGVALSFILSVIIATLLALMVSSDNATVRDRSRTQGLQSAEAAVSFMMDALQHSICAPDSGLGPGGPVTVNVEGRTVGQYQAIVRLPSEAGSPTPTAWDPNTAGPHCEQVPQEPNRVITAWGYGPSSTSTNTVVRRLDVTVQVTPLTGFRYTCFSGGTVPSQTLITTNNFVVQGDCYSTQSPMLGGNSGTDFTGIYTTSGSFTTPGVPSWTLSGSVRAAGPVFIRPNHTVSGDVTSATSSVTLQPTAKVSKDVSAATTINLSPGATIGGSRCPATDTSPGCPSAPPPALEMPTLSCPPSDLSCWQQLFPGMLSMTASQLSNRLLNTHRNDWQGSFFVSDGATSTLNLRLGGSHAATVTGPVIVITTGKIDLSGRLLTPPQGTPSVCTDGGPTTCIVSLVALVPSETSMGIEIFTPRFTADNTISLLLYTTGTLAASSGGTNPFSYRGVMYATTLDMRSNGMTFLKSQDLVDFAPPIVDWYASPATGYVVQSLSWRETPA